MASVIDIIDYMDGVGLIRKNKIMGKYYSICCPYHNNGNERHASSGVLINPEYSNGSLTPAGFFHCFTCGKVAKIQEWTKDVLSFHEVDEGVKSQVEAMVPDEENESYEGLLPSESLKFLNNKLAVDRFLLVTSTEKKTYVSEEELAGYRYSCKYMYDRGLTDQIIDMYDVGFDKGYVPIGQSKPVACVTFPVRDINGNCLFVARRAIDMKRFYLPKDIKKPVYGIYELRKYFPYAKCIAICESIFNALTLIKYGQPALALLGTGNSEQIRQLKLYAPATEYRLCLDPDEAGMKGTKRLIKGLSNSAFVFQYKGIPEGQDMNNLSYEEYQALTLE